MHSQSYGFSSSHVCMWELDHEEGWVQKNGCFRIVVLEKTLENPLIARRSNQSVLKEINPEYLLEGLMLKLKLQYFGHLMWRTDSFKISPWKRLRTEGEEGIRGWDGWMASLIQWTWTWGNSGRWWRPGLLQFTGSQRVDMTGRLNNNMILLPFS